MGRTRKVSCKGEWRTLTNAGTSAEKQVQGEAPPAAMVVLVPC